MTINRKYSPVSLKVEEEGHYLLLVKALQVVLMFIEAVLLLAGGSVDCSDLLVSGLAGAGQGHRH